MPLPDTLEAFTHHTTELCAMNIAYIQFILYTPFIDHPVGKKDASSGHVLLRAFTYDVLATYGALFKPLTAVLKDHSELVIRGRTMPKA